MTSRPFYKQPGWIASAAFLGLIVVAYLVTTVFASDNGQATSAVTPAHAGARAGLPCRAQQPVRSSVPWEPIPGVKWTPLGGPVAQKVPSRPDLGPGVIRGHIRECWQRSPAGAVLATYNYVALAGTFTSDTGMMRELTATGRARDAALRAGLPPTDTTSTYQPVGFAVQDYAPQAATVMIAIRVAPAPTANMEDAQSPPGLVGLLIRARWERNDWRVVLEPNDEAASAGKQLDSMAGLVPFTWPS